MTASRGRRKQQPRPAPPTIVAAPTLRMLCDPHHERLETLADDEGQGLPLAQRASNAAVYLLWSRWETRCAAYLDTSARDIALPSPTEWMARARALARAGDWDAPIYEVSG